MSRTVNQWRHEVEEILAKEGVRGFAWSYTGSTHQRVEGFITVKGGQLRSVILTCSLSPSDRKAAHHVRKDARRAVQRARELLKC